MTPPAQLPISASKGPLFGRSAPIWGLALGLASIGQLADLTHNWVVEHATCAEHGEIVHAGPHGETDSIDHGHGVASDSTSVPGLRSASHRDGDNHDHCRVGVDRQEHALDASRGSERLAADTRAARRPGLSQPAAPIALYRLAPKSSPPA